MKPLASLALGLLLAACNESQAPQELAEVRFRLETLCDFEVVVDLRIDAVVVGTESLRLHTQPRPVSNPYFVSAGQPHVLGAKWGTYEWPDTTVTLTTGQQHQQTLFIYCS